MPTAHVNDVDLYHEVRGSGPSVLFVSGATGDAGHFERVAELLTDEFTVVTYDRRGNSRSPHPVGWYRTSTDEQADEAAGLIEALQLAARHPSGRRGAYAPRRTRVLLRQARSCGEGDPTVPQGSELTCSVQAVREKQ